MDTNLKPIGGFFELELSRGNSIYHKTAIPLTNGRACINLILKKTKPHKIYIPFYTCDAIIEPITINKVDFEYYPIDEKLNPLSLPNLSDNEYFLYINYFGMKNSTVTFLIDKYGENLIVDNTHDFFNLGFKGLWSFTSARKYFGVPDGAYLYAPIKIKEKFDRVKEISISHLVNRLAGNQSLAYKQFLEHEQSFNSKILSISKISELLLSNINYKVVKRKRRDNFLFISRFLDKYNTLQLKGIEKENPFCYPFLPENYIDKSLLYKNNFFIPSYWLDTLQRNKDGFLIEKKLSKNLLPLPIDHRYNKSDLKKLIDFLTKLIKENKYE